MRYGVALGKAHPSFHLEIALEAERLGFESVWMAEHLVFPLAMGGSPYPGQEHPPVPPTTPVFDAFGWLCFLAGKTERIRLGTNVYLLGLRHPFVAARAVQTLDVVSNGRAEVGIGAGWLREEWIAAGVDPATRGRRLDEALCVVKRLWSEPVVEHHGEFYDFGPVAFEPKPVQKPWPRLHVGGESDAALAPRRAARRRLARPRSHRRVAPAAAGQAARAARAGRARARALRDHHRRGSRGEGRRRPLRRARRPPPDAHAVAALARGGGRPPPDGRAARPLVILGAVWPGVCAPRAPGRAVCCGPYGGSAMGEPPKQLAEAYEGWLDAQRKALALMTALEQPGTPQDWAEGYRWLTRMASLCEDWVLEKEDPLRPTIFRNQDAYRKLIVDNPDVNYWFVSVTPEHVYRLSGNRGTAPYLGFTIGTDVIRGAPGRTGTLAQHYVDQFEVAPDGAFEIVAAGARPAGHTGNFMALPEGTAQIAVRETFTDRRNAAPRLARRSSASALPSLRRAPSPR